MGRIQLLIEQMDRESGLQPSAIGMGTPGILDPQTQTLKNSNTVCLNGRPLQRDVEERVGVPFNLANDANCFALAEARLGVARGAESVFGVIMGTGVGGGIVIRDQMWPGGQGIAGEWGHNVIDPDGPPCYCGRAGCVETFISGPALQAFYATESGYDLSLSQIVQHHKKGNDAHATAAVQRLIAYFSRALASVINIFDPQVIVLGGGVSNVDLLYSEGVEAIQSHLFNDRLETRILRNQLGDSGGVFGAAMLVEKPCP